MYPALAVVDALAEGDSVVWIGGEGGMESALIDRAGIPFRPIPAAGVHGVGAVRLPGNLVRLIQGYWRSRRLLAEIQPEAVLFTGGYVGIPVSLAARDICRVAFVPDIEPALAMRWITRSTDSICVSTKQSLVNYPAGKRVRVSGYPSRFAGKVPTRDEGRRGLGLALDEPVLLVMGGSRGAHSINIALWSGLSDLMRVAQIVHLTGEEDWPLAEERSAENGASQGRYQAFPYLHERMGMALAAADLVVSRAGASVLGDFPHFALPSVLVPYPHAWRYQMTNAEHMSAAGASVTLPDGQLSQSLVPMVVDLLADPARLKTMAQACRSLAAPNAAHVVVQELRLAAEGGQPR